MTALAATQPISTSDPTVSIHVVREIVRTAERNGAARDELLRALDVTADILETADARRPIAEVLRISERAIELTNDPAFGLHWCEQLQDSAFAPISHLMSHSPTLRDAFGALLRFQSILSDDIGFTLEEHAGRAMLRCKRMTRESLVVQRFVSEMIVAGVFRLIRFFNPLAVIGTVSFTYAAPQYRAEYERVFGGCQRFEQPFTGITFEASLLSAPSPSRDEDLHCALHAIAEQRALRVLHRTPYALRVRALLLQLPKPHRSDMAAIARSLGLSPRTLRRRLSEEHTPFGTIVNETCAIAAKRMLATSELTIQEVAYEIGFSEPAAFHRAFKRWTGQTPSAFRHARLGA